MQLTDAVVLVTGASAGIGHAAAVRFATRGARVLVHGRDPERTQKVADEVRGRPLVADWRHHRTASGSQPTLSMRSDASTSW